jgi:hypothetical protein
MAQQYKKTTVSLHEKTLSEVTKRVQRFHMSHIIDRDLSRYYGLLEEHQTKFCKDFKLSELKKMATAIHDATGGARLTALPSLRAIIHDLCARGVIANSLNERIEKMDRCEFLALLDLLESMDLD